MPIMSTNFAKTLVWKHEYHMSLNEPPMKIFCVPP